ncbi:MAG: NAD(P)H-dependent glycerol-3-phosphate dehydrogenase [Marinilabiliales bacterium]|nr:MAG: NAD(P)H-dependent glycerol-3-phosphate dehydrogenase [Marinilabiliales bacterium]
MAEKENIALIGSGSWATALAKILLLNSGNLNWYVRNPGTIEYMTQSGHNPKYLSSVNFDVDRINFYNDLEKVVKDSQILIFAVPSAYLGDLLSVSDLRLDDRMVVSAIKGIIPGENLTIAEFFNRHYGVPFDNIGIITGPCHAEEVALERLSYLTIASKTEKQAQRLASYLECHFIRTVITKDIYGTEYAAVLKNVFSIAAGVCHGLGYGDNFQAVLVSNSIREIKRFLDNTWPGKRTINSSAYLGDLLVTAYSQFSRNRSFGVMIGKGYSVRAAMLEMNMVAEGYHATRCIKEINKKHNISLPITDTVYNILHEGISPAVEIRLLTEKLA